MSWWVHVQVLLRLRITMLRSFFEHQTICPLCLVELSNTSKQNFRIDQWEVICPSFANDNPSIFVFFSILLIVPDIIQWHIVCLVKSWCWLVESDLCMFSPSSLTVWPDHRLHRLRFGPPSLVMSRWQNAYCSIVHRFRHVIRLRVFWGCESQGDLWGDAAVVGQDMSRFSFLACVLSLGYVE